MSGNWRSLSPPDGHGGRSSVVTAMPARASGVRGVRGGEVRGVGRPRARAVKAVAVGAAGHAVRGAGCRGPKFGRALCRDRAADARFRSRRRWSITSRSDAVILRLRAAVVPARSARASWSSATSAGGRGDDLRRRVRVILRLGAGVGWAGGVGGTPAAAATGAAATAGVAVGGGAHGAGMTCPTVGAETEAANGVAGPSGGAAAAVPTLVVRACAPATGSGAWPETNDGSGSGIGGALPR